MKKIFYSYFNENDIDNILNSLKYKTEYTCTIPYPDHTSELILSRVISLLLENLDIDNIQQHISIILNELIHNSNRMNFMYNFFTNNNLDITNEEDFNTGQNLLVNGDYYKKYQNKDNYIKIRLVVRNRELYIYIENGRKITSLEEQSYKDLIKYSNLFNNVEELFYDNNNISETVDFGLILSILLLKQMNINKNSIIITPFENFTTTELTIPFLQLSHKMVEDITYEISEEIKSLPQFPDSIKRLQSEINDPEWDYEHITDTILSDAALTVEVLKLVNSPVYRVSEKIDTVSVAVKKIGIKGLNSLLYDFGSMKILESVYNIEQIDIYKKHLFQVALISSYIANKNGYKSFAEDIYIAALMHDIGKIIIQAINGNITEKLSAFCHKNKISLDIIDKLSDGYNHTIIGTTLAQKWNFPEKYINAIKYHHLPDQVSPKYKIITYCVYLGNEITQVLNNRSKFSNINIKVLKLFNLDNKEIFEDFIIKIQNDGIVV